MREHGRLGPIEWATVNRPLESKGCGDHSIAIDIKGSAALFGVLDGLGHGAEAATAAMRGVNTVRGDPNRPLGVLLQLCHRALADTRGAAMTLARIDFEAEMLTWSGIGNVTAHLIGKDPGGLKLRSSASLAGGIIGYQMPETVRTQTVSIRRGDLLIMTSDGIAESYFDSIDLALSASAIAERILDRHRKENDDALVLCARHRGCSP